jgi:hypothetical protein
MSISNYLPVNMVWRPTSQKTWFFIDTTVRTSDCHISTTAAHSCGLCFESQWGDCTPVFTILYSDVHNFPSFVPANACRITPNCLSFLFTTPLLPATVCLHVSDRKGHFHGWQAIQSASGNRRILAIGWFFVLAIWNWLLVFWHSHSITYDTENGAPYTQKLRST